MLRIRYLIALVTVALFVGCATKKPVAPSNEPVPITFPTIHAN